MFMNRQQLVELIIQKDEQKLISFCQPSYL
jgi:hypothetical protein